METAVKSKWAIRLFSHLVRRTLDAGFRFPGGAAARRAVEGCIVALEERIGPLDRERVADFCICQVYTLSFTGSGPLRRRWQVTRSFSTAAIERFMADGKGARRREDRWLAEHGLARGVLADLVRDRSQHPLAKFIYPQYEDRTKARQAGTEAGLYVCSLSTLLWTPFSPVCRACAMAGACRRMTGSRYPELLRIREEEYAKGGVR